MVRTDATSRPNCRAAGAVRATCAELRVGQQTKGFYINLIISELWGQFLLCLLFLLFFKKILDLTEVMR